MQRDLLKLIAYEARVKPHVREIYDRCHEMTDEEIDQSSVPLPWMKEALKRVRDQRTYGDQEAAREAAIDAMMVHNDPKLQQQENGEMYRFDGMDGSQGKTHFGTAITLRNGELILVAGGIVWLGSIALMALPEGATFISPATRSEYLRRYLDAPWATI